jgi:hypothetical protein
MAAAPVAGSAAEWSKSAANGEGSAADWSSQKGANAEKALASELRTLWIWNLVCFILHLVQGVACLAAALAVERIKNFRLPITTQFLQWTSAGPGLPVRPTQVSATLGYLPFVAVTSGFAFLSAAAHAAVLLRWRDYTNGLAKGYNRFRWYEYALSSSLMIVLIAMLFGVYDLFALIGIGAINAAMCLFGDLHEVVNAKKEPADVDWAAYIYGTLAGLVPWGIIVAYIAATPQLDQVPKFVWAILVIYFLLFQTFPITMYMQYTQRCWCRNARYPELQNGGYYAGERTYQTLSLVAKSLLLWLVVGGTNQPN